MIASSEGTHTVLALIIFTMYSKIIPKRREHMKSYEERSQLNSQFYDVDCKIFALQ